MTKSRIRPTPIAPSYPAKRDEGTRMRGIHRATSALYFRWITRTLLRQAAAKDRAMTERKGDKQLEFQLDYDRLE